jgi:Zn finger protein HypA/HybF involved in hydrogenase expression
MGSRIKAKCTCGYAAEVTTGCGMQGPVPDYFPAYCPRCAEVVPADATTWPTVCSRCGDEVRFYDARELQLTPGSLEVLDERTVTDPAIRHRLNDGAYLCPKCREFGLRFRAGGLLWD